MKKYSVAIIIIFFFQKLYAKDNDSIYSFSPKHVFFAEGLIYGGTMIGLNALWYKDYPHSSFHWFDDRKEWLQMDKMGHGFSSYYLTDISFYLFNQTKLKRGNNDLLYGSITAWVYISSVEIFDGLSQKWGASYSDLIANTIGVGMFSLQEMVWKKQIIVPKFSFHQTKFSNIRPNALGENFLQNVLKDYNGQSYWLSASINELLSVKFFPKWLCFSVGYSADGLLGGKNNPDDLPYYQRQRQYLLSLDIDFRKVNVRSKFLSQCFKLINVLKFPFPAIVFNGKKITSSTFYF